MALGVTIALGTTKFAFGRLERLLLIIKAVNPDGDQEMILQDETGRWSYTVTVPKESLPELRRALRKNGRYKITRTIDYEDGQVVEHGR